MDKATSRVSLEILIILHSNTPLPLFRSEMRVLSFICRYGDQAIKHSLMFIRYGPCFPSLRRGCYHLFALYEFQYSHKRSFSCEIFMSARHDLDSILSRKSLSINVQPVNLDPLPFSPVTRINSQIGCFERQLETMLGWRNI